MKLDPDCIRDVLLCLEKYLESDEYNQPGKLTLSKFSRLPEVSKYSEDEILYTSEKLHEGGFINLYKLISDNKVYFASYNSITYEGHQLIDSIRPETAFQKTKKTLSKVGEFALATFERVAVQCFVELFKSNL